LATRSFIKLFGNRKQIVVDALPIVARISRLLKGKECSAQTPKNKPNRKKKIEFRDAQPLGLSAVG
jgi:hypothetical protein